MTRSARTGWSSSTKLTDGMTRPIRPTAPTPGCGPSTPPPPRRTMGAVLPDWMIAAAAERGMISPFRREQLNPASYDLLLGDDLLIERAGTLEMASYPLSQHSEAKPYLLQPGQFVLASTQETFALPNWVAAKFVLKSSRAREGLQHLLAGWCDPGWNGSRLTLELKNIRQLHPISLWPGMKIGQMVFLQLAAEPDRSYAETGRYNGDGGVQGSKG